ncbi:MAG: hypothetical protein KG029_12675 [Bacteroidetes bacterium]|nr:hypothetical protein [Bacteroidota bacterium]
MKKITVLLVFLTLHTMFNSCKKDEEKTDIAGTYQRPYIVGGQAYQVQLSFTGDGILLWEPVETIPGHTRSYVKYSLVYDNKIKIFDDPDCNSESVYQFLVSDTKLTLTPETETCEPRSNALSGDWPKVK